VPSSEQSKAKGERQKRGTAELGLDLTEVFNPQMTRMAADQIQAESLPAATPGVLLVLGRSPEGSGFKK
jgi:hypothetical protein